MSVLLFTKDLTANMVARISRQLISYSFSSGDQGAPDPVDLPEERWKVFLEGSVEE